MTTSIPFDSPVGTEQERRSQEIYPGRWKDDNPYKTRYSYDTSKGRKEAHHTGSDLNLHIKKGDENEPVFAVADGIVTFAGHLDVWGNVIVIKHADTLFSRYGHVQKIQVQKDNIVERGKHIANVGNAPGMPFHLHFDISHTAVLEKKPWHWPGLDLPELEANYVDPAEYIRNHRPIVTAEMVPVITAVIDFLWVGRVKAPLGLKLRTEPSTAQGDATKIRGLVFGSLMEVLEELNGWYRVRADGDEGFVSAEWVERIDAPVIVATPIRGEQAGSTPQPSQTAGSGQMIDLLAYLRGDGRAYMIRSQQTGNQELVFAIQENNRFYTCKGEFHFEGQGIVCNWEEMWEETGFIMRGTDTSPDEERYYIQREPGREGSRWVKRHMQVGESVKSAPFVQFYLKKDGSKHSGNSGQANNTITLIQHHGSISFPGAITCEDVIELKWEEGKEVYYYMKNVGLVGWKGLHDGHTLTFNTVSEWLHDRELPKRLIVQLPQV